VQHLLGLILLLQAQVHQDGAGDEEVGLIGVATLGVLHEHAAELGRIGAPYVVLLRPPIIPYERTSFMCVRQLAVQDQNKLPFAIVALEYL
jgi:hypothetical protein